MSSHHFLRHVLIVAAVGGAFLPANGNLRAAPFAFYTFDDSSDTFKDDSGNGNALTQPGVAGEQPTYGASGGFSGGVYNFDGNDRLIAPINISPNVMPNVTFGAWVQTSSLASGNRKVMGHDNGGGDRVLGLDTRGDNFAAFDFRYSAFTGSPGTAGGLIESPAATFAPTSTSDWTFVAVSYAQGASTATVYADLNASTTADPLAWHTKSPTAVGNGHTTLGIGSLSPTGGEGWQGSIDNAFVYREAFTLSQMTHLRNLGSSVLVAPNANQLLSVDFEAGVAGGSFNSAPPATMSGVGPSGWGSAGDAWNAVHTPTYNLHAAAPLAPQDLFDSNGDATSVKLTLGGNVLGYNFADNATNPLTRDFLFFNANGTSSELDFELSGLDAGKVYELVVYAAGPDANRQFSMTVDTNGDGLFTDEFAQTVVAGGTHFSLLTASVDGKIIAKLTDTNEGNLAGFQLRAVDTVFVPEPSSFAMLGTALAFCGLGLRRRR